MHTSECRMMVVGKEEGKSANTPNSQNECRFSRKAPKQNAALVYCSSKLYINDGPSLLIGSIIYCVPKRESG